MQLDLANVEEVINDQQEDSLEDSYFEIRQSIELCESIKKEISRF